jgi:hypothetical protein
VEGVCALSEPLILFWFDMQAKWNDLVNLALSWLMFTDLVPPVYSFGSLFLE